MKNSQIRLVIILGILSIFGIISVQVYWLIKGFDLKEKQFNETIHTALHNVVEKMSPESISNEDIINQLSSDYFVVNVNDVIDANVLEYYLSNEFKKLQVNLDYEYAIYDCKSDQMMYGCYIKLQNDVKEGPSTNLQTYDEFIYYFGVKFPTKSSYVLQHMSLSIFFSIVLFLAIAIFGYALYFIFRQRKISELQTDFINNMTHEFKTPISSIGLASDVLLKNKSIIDDKKLFNYSSIIKNQSQRLNSQVEKVLQLAKNQNIFDLNLEEIELNQLIETVVKTASISYEKAGGIINFQKDGNAVKIKADKFHFTNILHNILDNSLKYCKSSACVDIKVIQTNKLVLISISDNGLGINKKHLSSIFDKFYRVPTGDVHNVRGFGLGLFYVKKIVDQHHWKLDIESEEGKGTEIIVKIKTE